MEMKFSEDNGAKSKMRQNELAMNGGSKAVSEPLPNRFHFGKEEKEAIDALFHEAMETGQAPGYNGSREAAFCQEFAAELGGGYVDGTNSGTTSVFVALKALDLPPLSEVIVGCITDPGGVMPVVCNDCIPIPADAKPGTFAPGPEEIAARITERTSAIVIAHIFGDPTDVPGIMKVAAKYNLPVVEDCAQAHLTYVAGQRAGTLGTISAFSLMFGKHICAGGQGGAVFTKEEPMSWKVRQSADRGKPFGVPGGSNLFPSLNFNMDEIHATIASVQLKKLHGIVQKRRQGLQWLYEHGGKKLQGVSLPQVSFPKGWESSLWFVRLHFNAENMNCTRDEYMKALNAEGVSCDAYYAGFPFSQQWYVNRASTFPWTCSDYKGDPKAEYPCPNIRKTLDSEIKISLFESYGQKELGMILKALQKLDEAYRKR